MKEKINMEDGLNSMYTSKFSTTETILADMQTLICLLKDHVDDKEELERLINNLHDYILSVADNHTKEYHIFSMLYHNTKI